MRSQRCKKLPELLLSSGNLRLALMNQTTDKTMTIRAHPSNLYENFCRHYNGHKHTMIMRNVSMAKIHMKSTFRKFPV